MITLLATAPLGKLSKDFLTALIPSKFVILVYRDHSSQGTKFDLHGIVSIALIFPERAIVSCI